MTAKYERALRSAVASARIEGLDVSRQTEQDCRRYLEGKMDTDTLIREALRRYHEQGMPARIYNF